MPCWGMLPGRNARPDMTKVLRPRQVNPLIVAVHGPGRGSLQLELSGRIGEASADSMHL